MKEPGLPADQQFFADLFSGLVLNPQRLGRVWFATQHSALPPQAACVLIYRVSTSYCAENTVTCSKKNSTP